jgi:hypothetical protein
MFVHPTTALLVAAERRRDIERRTRVRPVFDMRTVRPGGTSSGP